MHDVERERFHRTASPMPGEDLFPSVAPPILRGDSVPDRDLVLGARAGDARAKEALYRRHAHMVIGMTYRILGQDRDVSDVVQDIFAKAFECLDQLQDPQAVAAWLGSITVRHAREHLRRRRLRRTLGLERSEPTEIDGLASRSASPETIVELKGIYRSLERLPREVRIALLLHRVESISLPEIAQQMRVSLSTIKRRIAEGENLLARPVSRRSGHS